MGGSLECRITNEIGKTPYLARFSSHFLAKRLANA
jgi:hypothetical protein